MRCRIFPGSFGGSLGVPPSKSETQRAGLMAALASGNSVLRRVGHSADERAIQGILKPWGALLCVEKKDAQTDWHISGTGGAPPKATTFDCHESGLAARLLIPIASALSKTWITITANKTLTKRPQSFYERILPRLVGAQIQTTNGHTPVRVRGPWRRGVHDIDLRAESTAVISSQYISGLLVALAATKPRLPVRVLVRRLPSKPYVALTAALLNDFGAQVQHSTHEETDTYTLEAPVGLRAANRTIEGDWSAAATWLVAAALHGRELKLNPLCEHSLQADRLILNILKQAGASYHFSHPHTLHLRAHQSPLRGFDVDLTHAPDLFIPAAALALVCEGGGRLKGLSRLVHKESNRKKAMLAIAKRFHLEMRVREDTLMVPPHKAPLCVDEADAPLPTFGDHRMAMFNALLALRAARPLLIEDAEVVAKSFPDFFTCLQRQSRCECLPGA